ncbi:hypothetical protein [Streptomyces sp. NPDC048496]|uniref:hypothetical protein n=1 Tax=Streptomyces sp. NPDC048496 TaxID=3365558 RepID=UPI0037136243
MQWYLLATCEIPETVLNAMPDGFDGVDLGIVNIATTSTGARYSGRRLNRARENARRVCSKLQRKGTGLLRPCSRAGSVASLSTRT